MKTKEIITTANAAKSHYAQFHTTLDSYLYRFMSKFSPTVESALGNRAKIFVPKTYSTIKRKVASLFETYLNADGIFTVSGNDAEVLNGAINHYERNKPFKSVLTSVFYDFYIYGIGITRTFWSFEGPVVERVDPRDFAFDVDAKSLGECRYFVHSYFVDGSVLDSYGVEKKVSKGLNKGIFSRYAVDDFYYFDNGWNVASIHANAVFRTALLRRHPFSFGYALAKIYEKYAMNGIDGVMYSNVYGDSECRVLAPLQDELNEIRSQMRDTTRDNLTPRILAETGSGLSSYDWFNSAPGDVLYVNNLRSIQFAPTPSVLQASNEIKNLDLEIQEASGVTSYNSGISRAGMLNQTATGMSILTSEGNTKIAAEIRTVHETFFKDFGELYVSLVAAHAPKALMRGIRDRREVVYDVEIEIEKPGENKELKKQRLVESLQLLGNIDPQSASTIAKDALLPMLVDAKTLEKLQGEQNGLQQPTTVQA
ncbi:MAG: hypothetical protein PHX44_01335 [Sulfurimonas sp.]|uniref:portal protein n=1 Tax=Sulfurimonas sp. TaxID=2022749 RepID=UPI00262A45EB|nr:hypothetical protein [Sulfurimonas sp.]MDD2651676.1 hypothetical protein [Sulfurimonas sp.]MDD3451487.1 hypothetical protein [Sulfurimonas sp.]